MTRDIGDRHLVAVPATRAGQLGEHPDGHAAGGLGEDPLGPRQQAHRLDDLLFAHGLDHATGLARDPVYVHAVGWVADRDRAGDGVGPDRQDPFRLVRVESVVDRRTPHCLRAGHGWDAVAAYQPEVEQLADRLPVADELAATADRDDDLVRELPAALFRRIERERLGDYRVGRADEDG